jgi:hypothetical protein
LSYSFTGEKVTDQQLLEVYKNVRQAAGISGAIFTCFPKLNKGKMPGYVFVCIAEGTSAAMSAISAEQFDQALMAINEEYAGKRTSGRLAKPEVIVCRHEELAQKLMRSDPRYRKSSPAQLKPLPLYSLLWDSLYAEGEIRSG